jgi:hypothetical protein
MTDIGPNSTDHKETIFRVYDLPEELREAVRSRRDALEVSTRKFVAEAIGGELPSLLRVLREVLPSPAGPVRPIRLPMTAGLLDALREAGAATGLPAKTLLLACLLRASRRKRRASGHKAAKGDDPPGEPADGTEALSA